MFFLLPLQKVNEIIWEKNLVEDVRNEGAGEIAIIGSSSIQCITVKDFLGVRHDLI